MALSELGLRPLGSGFTDASIPSLSAGQAAGTTAILAANTSRTALKIVPPADCTLTISAASTVGIPLYGGVENTFEGGSCPTNDLFVRGLSVSAALTIWES